MISRKLLFALCTLIIIVTSNSALAGYVSGIETGDSNSSSAKGKSTLEASESANNPSLEAVAIPPAHATVINFDDVSATCSWSSTNSRLTNEYAGQGVIFSGPGGLDGGAIIDECGNFPVTGQSSPNFLGFNPGGSFVDGGTPIGPETMTFSPAVGYVQINGASGVPITMECFAGQVSVGTSTIPATVAIETLSVTAPGIDSCVLSWESQVAVFDDLAFADSLQTTPVPTLGTWALILMAVLLVFVGMRVRRLRTNAR